MRRLASLLIGSLVLGLGCGQDPSQKEGALAPSLNDLDGVSLYLNLGDSVGWGLYADPGRGYANLVYGNHVDYPAWDDHCVHHRFTDAVFVQDAVPGDDSYDMADQVRRAPEGGGGDVVVTIYVGGNDITANPLNLFSTTGINSVIDGWTTNMTGAIADLKEKYQQIGEGRDLIIALATVHDPTGDTGVIPPEFTSGFCSTLQQIPANKRDEALQHFGELNDAIRQFAADNGVLLVDSYQILLDHGMNATGSDRWIADDCIHLTNEGHHELRVGYWEALTGEKL